MFEVVCYVYWFFGLSEFVKIYLIQGLLCADFYTDCHVPAAGGETHTDYLTLSTFTCLGISSAGVNTKLLLSAQWQRLYFINCDFVSETDE